MQIQMYKERDGEIETGHYFPRSDRVIFFNFKSNLPCHVYLSVVHASVYIYRERQRKWKKQWNRGAQDGKEVTGSFAQSRDIFFSFIRSVPSLWQLRAIYVTAKLSLLMRFFRPRARARDFDPIWTLVPASTHPKSEMPESIMLVYRHASSINPRIFQSHAFLHLHVHRRQRTTTTTA